MAVDSEADLERLAGYLANRASAGLPMPSRAQIGASLGLVAWRVAMLLRRLEDRGTITPLAEGGYEIAVDGLILLLAQAKGSRGARIDAEARIRACLKCKQSFLSPHNGRRLCDPCNHLNSQYDGEAFRLPTSGTGFDGRRKMKGV